METVNKLMSMLTQFGSMGPAGWIASGGLLIVAFFVYRWAKGKLAGIQDAENTKNRLRYEQDLPQEQARLERDVRESTFKIRDHMTRKEAARFALVQTSIECRSEGSFMTPSKQPMGVVIHATAGRSVNSIEDAERELKGMAEKGLGALVMGDDGTIYAPKNWTGKEVFFHAGDSEWKGKKSLSDYCVGLEVACAGKLEATGLTWWGDGVPEAEIREAPDGFYHVFTEKQERAITTFCRVLQKSSPDFDLNFVVGHHEIAPMRKSDPGGSFSVSMPVFRSILSRVLAER